MFLIQRGRKETQLYAAFNILNNIGVLTGFVGLWVSTKPRGLQSNTLCPTSTCSTLPVSHYGDLQILLNAYQRGKRFLRTFAK